MITNLDRLHKVVSGELVGRNCGKTFSKCHEIVTLCEFNDTPFIIVLIKHYHDVKHTLPKLYAVFADRGVPVGQIGINRLVSGDILSRNNKITIDFIVGSRVQEIMGISEYYIVDMNEPSPLDYPNFNDMLRYKEIQKHIEDKEIWQNIEEHMREEEDFYEMGLINKYTSQDEFLLDDESVRYDREVLKNYKW